MRYIVGSFFFHTAGRPQSFLKCTVHFGTDVCHGIAKVILSRLTCTVLPRARQIPIMNWFSTREKTKYGGVMVSLNKEGEVQS